MMFWAVATILAVMAAWPVVTALLRTPDMQAEAPDLAVYRDQLAEVERDLARGVLTTDEAARIRVEVQRRLLDADRADLRDFDRAPGALSGAAAMLVGVTLIGGAIGVYNWQGAPGYPDLPLETRLDLAAEARSNRISQADAVAGLPPFDVPAPNAEFAALMDQLRAALQTRPDDLAGHRLLARNEAGLGNFDAAIAAQNRVIAILGKDVTATEQARLAQIMITQAGGYVAPEAEAVIDAALALSPGNGIALYYKGLAHTQLGRPDLAFRLWRPLLEQSPPDAPWVPQIRAQILEIAARAGVRYALPQAGPGPGGPGAAEIEAAGGMSADERAAMINTMVAGLSDRLATEGGPATDWARLIAAYGVLGRRDAARAIWDEARETFASVPADLAVLQDAAEQAGLVE